MRWRVLATRLVAVAALLFALSARAAGPVEAVGAIGITVSDLDRASAFYRDVLGFTVEPAVEVAGGDYEHLQGVFGLRMRVKTANIAAMRVECGATCRRT